MGTRRRTLAALETAASLLVIACATSALGACGGGPEPGAPLGGGGPPGDAAPPAPAPDPAPQSAPSPPAPRPPVRVSFKLDPVLTGGLYMGERWVSPPVFQAAAQTGSTFRVEARAEVVGGSAAPFTWAPSDPDAVAVSPQGGRHVEILVSRPGRSAHSVSAGADSTSLAIDAVQADGRWLVTFSE
jgi:hypothetical protein